MARGKEEEEEVRAAHQQSILFLSKVQTLCSETAIVRQVFLTAGAKKITADYVGERDFDDDVAGRSLSRGSASFSRDRPGKSMLFRPDLDAI